MDIQHFTDNGQQKFPLSTEALAFIQEQIELGYKLTNLAGQNIIILEPTAAKEGLVIFDGELLPMAKIARGSYTRIAISETTESLSIEGFSGNVRTRRFAYYTNSGGSGEAKKLVSVFTSLKSISTLMTELDAAKKHIMPKGSIIDWYGVCRCAYIPYGFVPCGWFGQEIPEGQHASELAAWQAKYPNNISISRTYDSGRRLYITACNGQTVPNLTDRFIVQAGHNYALGNTGGETHHTMTMEEIPQHKHIVPWGEKSSVYTPDWGFATSGSSKQGASGNDKDNDYIYTSPVGGQANGHTKSHENRPPYYALYKLIKVI